MRFIESDSHESNASIGSSELNKSRIISNSASKNSRNSRGANISIDDYVNKSHYGKSYKSNKSINMGGIISLSCFRDSKNNSRADSPLTNQAVEGNQSNRSMEFTNPSLHYLHELARKLKGTSDSGNISKEGLVGKIPDMVPKNFALKQRAKYDFMNDPENIQITESDNDINATYKNVRVMPTNTAIDRLRRARSAFHLVTL